MAQSQWTPCHHPSASTVERGLTQACASPAALAVIKSTPELVRRSVESAQVSDTPGIIAGFIENVNIAVPVVDPAPVVTLSSLNAAILTQLDTALSGLHNKAGIPMHSRVIVNNLNITTNILTGKKASLVAPDTSVLKRVKRVPTEPRSSIPNMPTNPTHIQILLLPSQPSLIHHFPSRCIPRRYLAKLRFPT
ncbi:hypothetical protein N7491_000674 [Penicillium cf. griseofulvum]|uniref:Uncharacterized protein n=1 Tax=Penicillium cf. griseofulvum TaxID=2972120 RepID=A0A9W9LXT0_9EURO|nr:hypothetical protein N7472_011079 [Penicillium cf. griseofulvum]KAJ5442837.1 hypothetical protein N7445_004588 [Penicillium cf. griseofulvum]KAJ5451492.1 hypothetical protein N7491_000674 [Penicillium cf. griseofulvum]